MDKNKMLLKWGVFSSIFIICTIVTFGKMMVALSNITYIVIYIFFYSLGCFFYLFDGAAKRVLTTIPVAILCTFVPYDLYFSAYRAGYRRIEYDLADLNITEYSDIISHISYLGYFEDVYFDFQFFVFHLFILIAVQYLLRWAPKSSQK